MNINVCIPAYNAEKTIERTIRNIQLQTVKQYNIYIYDDGSIDGTYEKVKKMSQDDSRISIIRGVVNKGRAEARNALLSLVNKNSIIAWQDADDLWHPQKLYIQCKIYMQNMHYKNKDIIYTSTFRKPFFCSDGDRLMAEKIFGPQRSMRIDPPANYDEKHIFSKNFGLSPFYLQGTFGPASAYIDIGGFDNKIQWAEDLDIVIRLIANNTKIFGYKTKQCLLRYQLNLPSVPISTLCESIVNAASKGVDIKSLSKQVLEDDVLWRKAFYIFRLALLRGEYKFALDLMNENKVLLSKQDWGRKLIDDNSKLMRVVYEMSDEYI